MNAHIGGLPGGTVALLTAFASLTGCTVGEPPEPAAGSFEWITYANDAAGFVLEVPDVWTVDEEDGGATVFFRADQGVPVKVYWITDEQGRGRGLWLGEQPVGETELAGVAGRRFEYTHCDGPLCSRMVSFVIAHRDRHLALEFRSDGPLNQTNRHVLDSFRLAGPEDARRAPASPAGR